MKEHQMDMIQMAKRYVGFCIKQLSMSSLRMLSNKIGSILYDSPVSEDLRELKNAIDLELKSDPRYIKGLALFKDAEENAGLDSGYARGQDYYFATFRETITNWEGKKIGQHTKLLVCFKWNWWMNGEVFLPQSDGDLSRNFSDFLKDEWINDSSYEGDSFGDIDPEDIKKQLINSGLEELPALIPFYKAHCVAFNKRYEDSEKVE